MKHPIHPSLALLLALILSPHSLIAADSPPDAASLVTASVWPQWRGPSRNSHITPAKWPESLDDQHLTPLWRTELAESYCGPIVAGDHVFTVESTNDGREVVRALDRDTGQERWRHEWVGAMRVPFFARKNGSWVRSTPAYDDGRLFVAGMRDVLVCLNAADGELIWQVDFVESLGTPLPEFGFVCSPLVVGDHLYVQAGAGFVKLDKATGEIIWRTLEDVGGMWGSAFSSPVHAVIQGREQLVVQTREKLAGVDPADGAVLWEQPVKAFRGMNILTPTVIGDRIFTSSYGGGTFMYEIVTDDQGNMAVETLWENKVQGYMSSPVVIDDHIYLHTRDKHFVCFEIATGRETWRSDETFGEYWSIIASGDRLLCLDQRGELLLIHANPEKLDILSRREIAEQETWAHLAIVNDEIFIRELRGMAAWRWSE